MQNTYIRRQSLRVNGHLPDGGAQVWVSSDGCVVTVFLSDGREVQAITIKPTKINNPTKQEEQNE